ncbi:MAG TPA: hypothetical protein DCF33_00690 [Saprospirales bacterium]|nr:hypothetical protein [Saprospirales bacterium]
MGTPCYANFLRGSLDLREGLNLFPLKQHEPSQKNLEWLMAEWPTVDGGVAWEPKLMWVVIPWQKRLPAARLV